MNKVKGLLLILWPIVAVFAFSYLIWGISGLYGSIVFFIGVPISFFLGILIAESLIRGYRALKNE